MPKKPFTRQHYIPCSYLANFSSNKKDSPRKSFILRTDSNIANLPVKVETQCYADFFYSEKNAAKVEAAFKEIEDEMARLIEDSAKRTLTTFELKLLMLQAIYMYGRGINVESQIYETGFERFNSATTNFLKLFFYNKEIDDIKSKLFADYIFKEYESYIVNTRNEKLITSDSPVQVFQNTKQKAVILLFMPLSPQKALIAFKKSEILIKKRKLSDKDVGFMNACQSANSVEAVYSIDEFDKQSLINARKSFKRRSNPKIHEMDGKTKYILQFASDLIGKLSFIKKCY